jgi:hypothetical protein
LNIIFYSLLKHVYFKEIELFIKALINYIIKLEFFIVFKVIYFAVFKENNIKSGFKTAGLILYNPDEVISKLDIYLRISISGLLHLRTASTYNF